VTVERGHDPRRFGLVAFGGAGPMHAAALADGLDIETVVVPRACGVLSAYGLLAADEKHDSVRTLRSPLAGVDVSTVEAAYDGLRDDVLADVETPADAAVSRAADLRYDGQSFELTVPVGEAFDPDAVAERFHEAHEGSYGYRLSDPVELVNLRSTAVVERGAFDVSYRSTGEARKDTREAFFDGGFRETPVYAREGLGADAALDGPVVLEQSESTVVVPPGWRGTVGADGTLTLTRGGEDR
jgi:N-methylhydantoinase A